jgi:hypothetical protein
MLGDIRVLAPLEWTWNPNYVLPVWQYFCVVGASSNYPQP